MDQVHHKHKRGAGRVHGWHQIREEWRMGQGERMLPQEPRLVSAAHIESVVIVIVAFGLPAAERGLPSVSVARSTSVSEQPIDAGIAGVR
jgi:hypothetical protein